jgi:hypothetical protein
MCTNVRSTNNMASTGPAKSHACVQVMLHDPVIGKDGGSGVGGQLATALRNAHPLQQTLIQGASRLLCLVSFGGQLLDAAEAFLHSTGGASALPSAGSAASCLQSVRAAGLKYGDARRRGWQDSCRHLNIAVDASSTPACTGATERDAPHLQVGDCGACFRHASRSSDSRGLRTPPASSGSSGTLAIAAAHSACARDNQSVIADHHYRA